MKIMLLVSALAVAIIVAVALLLPCEGCRLRRERLRRAYEHWRATQKRGDT